MSLNNYYYMFLVAFSDRQTKRTKMTKKRTPNLLPRKRRSTDVLCRMLLKKDNENC